MALPELPDDIYDTIFQHLALADLVSLRRVSRRLEKITHLRSLWLSLLHTEIWDRHIPTPGLNPYTDSLDDLTALQLERYVRDSLELYRNWTSAAPVVMARRRITAADAHVPQTRIISLHFVSIRGRLCLLSFSITQRIEPRMITLECWDISSSRSDPPKCIAQRKIRWFGGGYAVNSDHSSLGLIAIRAPLVEILTVDFDATSVEAGFIILKTLTAEAKAVLAFSGSTLVFKDLDDAVMLLDITRPQLEVKLDHPQPLLAANEPDSFEAVIQQDYAVILRPKTLELYPLTRFRTGCEALKSISPVAVHQFQFRIDSCRIERHLSPHHPDLSSMTVGSHSQVYPIHILIRYSSFFPWPVNLIHHYTLFPNRAYDPNGLGTSSDTVSATNLPYHVNPVLCHTISSPVRLFSISDMAIGRYGTALWVDSHTEDHFYQAEKGQRLAGRKLPALVNWDSTHSHDQPPGSQDQNKDVSASMVFGFNEKDDWNRVAVDDKEGCIAVGTIDGRIIIDTYI
ncbi:hypothetical protein K435DRAFT_729642 [Dendrothele bispora CBS 962.96]|uniref:F-box domain-containing protein n=1 Tax=Dendrothele bispora (strain CBS 962.96) TaxID=1314807 RepID=A0A4S8LI38_DENBC|nr:hypothetical protein K435DRAFT_729642 [Dendrothele bispora CBS 962.96]